MICSTTSNLNNFEPQQLEPRKRVQNEKKKQNRPPEPRNPTKDPPIVPLFIRHYATFLKLFGLHQMVLPPFVSILCNTMDVKKSQRVPLLHFLALRQCDSVQKSHFYFFGNFFKSPKGSTSFFFFVSTDSSFTKPVGSSHLQFRALDIAPTLAVLGVLFSCEDFVPVQGSVARVLE